MSVSKGIKNAGFGILAQVLSIAIGIIIPRLVLINLGSESNGLLSSVGNILSYMSLLEAGVGTATLQALYKPCATSNHDAVNGIMAATDFFYRRTGRIYFFIITALSIGYTFFVRTELPKHVVFITVFLSGMTGVISYFFQGKYKIFLSAEGKKYVNTNIVTTIHIINSLFKAVLLALGKGIIAIQIAAFVLNLIQMLVYIFYMRKNYKWLNTRNKPNFDAISQRNAVLIHQISTMIFSNTDVLLLTIFAGLKEVSVYSMYVMIFGMVTAFASEICNSYIYALGQYYNVDRAKFLKLFDAYEVISLSINFSVYCSCRFLITPFLKLYTSGVEDIKYVDPYLPWLFALFYLMHNGRTSSNTLISIAQRFDDTKWRSILESCINLTVSIICVIKFGIYGVLIGTIVALLYRTNDMIVYAAGIIKRSCWVTYKRWFLNLTVFAGLSFVMEKTPILANNYIQFLISAFFVMAFAVTVFALANAFFEREVTIYVIGKIRRILKSIKLYTD